MPKNLLQKLIVPNGRTLVMGVLNVTPDSFSDGGRLFSDATLSRDKVLAQADSMIAEGADIIDVGGESTRPGAAPVSVQQEMDRVLPVLEWLDSHFDIAVSVDSSSAELMRQAGAYSNVALLNDVRAFQRDGALDAAAGSELPVCIMHMQGEPDVMQQAPVYQNVVDEVLAFLQQRVDTCLEAGIAKDRILLDPGFGFGKTLQQNLALFRGIPALHALGCPLLIGVSRKTMVGEILNKPVEERLQGSVALALLAAQQGVRVLRVHDVKETVDALKVLTAVSGQVEKPC